MTFIVAGCALLLALLVGVVLGDIGVSPLSKLRLLNSRDLLPGVTDQADDPSTKVSASGRLVPGIPVDACVDRYARRVGLRRRAKKRH
jgi:hypothetical protein